MGIYWSIAYTKRAWTHLLQALLKRHFIRVRVFQRALSQSWVSALHIHPFVFTRLKTFWTVLTCQENGWSHLRTAQPFEGRNHCSSRMMLPSSSLIRAGLVVCLVSFLPLRYTVFTVPSGYSHLLNCTVWTSFWPLLNTTILSPFLKGIAVKEVMRRHYLLLTPWAV